MHLPKGVDANPYALTEPRELVLRCYATEQAECDAVTVTIERPVVQPLPLRPQDMAEAHRWLRLHGYLIDYYGLTARGWQVAAYLSRADRHDPIVDEATVPDPAQDGRLVPGSRVRCSCGWGGARNEQGPARLRVPYPPHRGGRQAAELLHAAHAREERGEPAPTPKPTRDPFARIPGAADPEEAW